MNEKRTKNKIIIDVYTAKIPDNVTFSSVFPPLREEELKSTLNKKVKTEKYCAWKLLEYGLKQSFGLNITDLKFSKTRSGKWVCDKCYFSISHSKNLIAVALSTFPVGIDCQLVRPANEKAIARFLTKSEKKILESLTDSIKNEYLISAWSKKESAYKCSAKNKFIPSKIDTSKLEIVEKTIVLDNDKYLLNVSKKRAKEIRYFEHVNFE